MREVSAMDSVLKAFVLDPSKSCHLSLDEKRELVHEIAWWSKEASEILTHWTRGELLEIICAEIGKRRKYSGFTKYRMIEHLLMLVSNKSNDKAPLSENQTGRKKQKTREHPIRLSDGLLAPFENGKEKKFKMLLCQNLACRANLSLEAAFCKRCSCCICHHYDDNKDPSLWLACDSDPHGQNGSCGMSFHLECALKDDSAGIVKNGRMSKLDGRFYCVSCGKINDLMRTWKKQLLVAKEARRVDVLCLRLSLSHKILQGTEQYKELQNTIATAVQKLKAEVGPLDWVCAEMARGIVNRLACGAEVQKLCASAVESLDSMSSHLTSDYIDQRKESSAACHIQFEESSPTSVTIVLEYEEHLLKDFLGCRLWHRKSTSKEYPEQPTYIVLKPHKRFKVTNLNPSTKYLCKVSLFSCTTVLAVCEAKWATPTLSGISLTPLDGKRQLIEDITSSLFVPPLSPCKSNEIEEVLNVCCRQMVMKDVLESDYDYSVRAVKWLEQQGIIRQDFRVKFLTWFSLKATMQERRVVHAFVDTLIDDPPSLAAQLVDTFMSKICSGPIASQPRFCTMLWH